MRVNFLDIQEMLWELKFRSLLKYSIIELDRLEQIVLVEFFLIENFAIEGLTLPGHIMQGVQLILPDVVGINTDFCLHWQYIGEINFIN